MKTYQYRLGIVLAVLSLFLCASIEFVSGSFRKSNDPTNKIVTFQTPEPTSLEIMLDPAIEWITYIGNENEEYSSEIVVDQFGSIYILSNSHSVEYVFDEDPNQILITKLDSSGNITWQTTLPASPISTGYDLTLKSNGGLYVAGTSNATWGDPLNSFSGEIDVFIAEVDTNGTVIWNTFLGDEKKNSFGDIAINTNGEIYVAFDKMHVLYEGFVADDGEVFENFEGEIPVLAKLSEDGRIIWTNEVENEGQAFFYDIEFAADGNIIAVGESFETWGDPLNPFSGGDGDGFIAKINSEGSLIWHTFIGGSGHDDAYRIVLDEQGNIYNCGYSDAPWGTPLNAHTGSDYDAYIAKTDSNGNLLWHTFVGANGDDIDQDFIFDNNGNLLLTGLSANTWGNPLNPYAGGNDGFIATFDITGSLLWNTFYGSTGDDSISLVQTISNNNLLIAGRSNSSFGNPLNDPSGNDDTFVANINLLGEPETPVQEPTSDAYRDSGPYVPEITRYIPTPLDVSTAPEVVGTNILVAVLLMLPFAVAVDIFTRLFTENENTLIVKFAPVSIIYQLQEKLKNISVSIFKKRKGIFEFLRLFGVISFYGLVFSLLDETWNPFTPKGVFLFISMVIAYGLIGILDDILQWRMIRKWNASAEFSIRPTNVFLVLASLGTSRLLSLLPGLMFGSPEALKIDEDKLSSRQNQTLIIISLLTYISICVSAWGATIFTYLIKEQTITEETINFISGIEALLLIIFAVALENVFIQVLGLSDGIGQKIRKRNLWLWMISVVTCAFAFLHTLLNPRYDFIKSLQQGNTSLFIFVAIFFILTVFTIHFVSKKRNNKKQNN